MAKRLKLHESNKENDIRYRGPISYQGFQVLGWLCLVSSVALAMLNLAAKADPYTAESLAGVISVLGSVSNLSLPFLLIANFSRILSNSEGYKKQLIRTGGTALAIFAGAFFLYSRYVIGIIKLFVPEDTEIGPMLSEALHDATGTGFVAFNVFIDLFLCALFMFFLNVRPKRVFTGKKVLFLRVFALLPVACEIFSMVMKYKSAANEITLPIWAIPLLTVKPPMTFVMFMCLAFHIKVREWRFCKHGRSHEEYLAFLDTNRNSRHFSIYLMIIMVVTALLDGLALVLFSAFNASTTGADLASEEEIVRIVENMFALGFGHTIPQLLLVPLMPFYSYSRIPKSKTFGMLIPVIGIALMFFIVLEFGYQALCAYIPVLIGKLQETMNSPEAVQVNQLLNTIMTTIPDI